MAGFVRAEDARRFGLARGFLRALLGSYLGVPAGDLRFEYGPHGKPALPGAIEFSLSHAGDLLAVAVGVDRAVGVDVEKSASSPDILALARRYFCPDEYRWLLAREGADQTDQFFRIWTRKEAYLKARGVGIGAISSCPSVLDDTVSDGYSLADLPVHRDSRAAVAAGPIAET
jgi:4'-phosphopantetheinyl transferase